MLSPTTADFIAGTVAGISGTVAGHPFDTLKVRLQTQTKQPIAKLVGETTPTQYRGAIDCAMRMMKQEGVRGLYKGVMPPVLLCSTMNALVFSSYGFFSRSMKSGGKDLKLSQVFMAGCAAGGVQNLIATPMELVKIQLQVQNSLGSSSSLLSQRRNAGIFGALFGSSETGRCVLNIFKEGGTFGIFRGFTSTLLRDVPAFGLYFLSYEWLRRDFAVRFSSEKTSSQFLTSEPMQILFAGGIGGMISWFFSYPIDVVKSQIQGASLAKTPSFYKVVITNYQESGLRHFGRGLTPTMLRAFPVNAVMFAAYEIVLHYLTSNEQDDLDSPKLL